MSLKLTLPLDNVASLRVPNNNHDNLNDNGDEDDNDKSSCLPDALSTDTPPIVLKKTTAP